MSGTKVLYLMYTGLIGQSGDQTLNLHRLRDLEELGAQTWVAALESPRNLAPEKMAVCVEEVRAAAASATVRFFPRRAAWPRAIVKELLGVCAEARPDVLIFTQAQGLLSVRALKKATQLPVLWDCRASPRERDDIACSTPTRMKNAVRRWAHGPAARLSEHLICVSDQHAQEMAETYGYERSRITVIRNEVDLASFRPDPAARQAVRRQLGIADGAVVIVYCGGMHAWQCFPESVELVGTASELGEEVEFLVLTPDVEAARGHLARARSSLRHRVLSVPHQEVPRYLAASDVGMLVRAPNACNIVASPMKFAEYLACGLPVVIGPAVGDYTQWVREKRLGVVVDPARREAWADSIRDLANLLSDTGLRERCRRVAGERLDLAQGAGLLGSAIAAAVEAGR